MAEIAVHETTGPITRWVAATIAKQAKKLAIVVGDGPGLVVNRLLMALLNEAQRLLAEGHGVKEIDRAATDFGWRLGPFQIMDVIGLRTVLDAGSQIAAHLPNVLDAPPFVVPLLKAGRPGRHAGVGFYRYPDGETPHWDDDVLPLLQAYVRPGSNKSGRQHATVGAAPDNPHTQGTPPPSNSQGGGEPDSPTESLAERLLAALIVQAAQLLDRGQLSHAADLDLCCLLALGFPPHHGGPLYWADHYPLGRLLESLDDAKLSEQLARHCGTIERFYK